MSAGALVWMDGAIVPLDQARVDVRSHAIQRGSLVFDVGALSETAAGGTALFRANDHVARFLRSAALVGLDVKLDSTALLEATIETVRANGASAGLVRWSALIPTLEADLVARPDAPTRVVIAVIPTDEPSAGTLPARVKISRDIRKAGSDVLPPQAKVAAAYLGPMLAKRRARAEGYDDVVLLDAESRIAETPTANVFVVADGGLVTPPVGRILSGVTRASVLEIARAIGLPAREGPLTPEDLAGADEAFLTATSLALRPVAGVDGRTLSGDCPGPITRRLRDTLIACRRGEDSRFGHWLTPTR